MSRSASMELVRRRWWVVLLAVAASLAAAGTYAWRQARVYESTATVYVHPSPSSLSHDSSAAVTSELGVLSYGSLLNTLLAIAQSQSSLRTAARAADVPPDLLGRYTTVASLHPKSFVIDMSVDGPDRTRVQAVTDRLSAGVARAVDAQYPVIAVSALAGASPATQIRPRVERDLFYGALAGVLVGLVLAAVVFPPQPRRERPPSDGEAGSNGAEPPRADSVGAELPVGPVA